MSELSLATVLSHPFGQLVVTVIVAFVTSVLTVRVMSARNDSRESPRPAVAAGPGPVRAAPAARDDAAVVAAISAAVYAVIGAHRIVFITDSRTGSSWTNEMRSQHHTSHAPHAHAPHH
jgi:hypothetical protein